MVLFVVRCLSICLLPDELAFMSGHLCRTDPYMSTLLTFQPLPVSNSSVVHMRTNMSRKIFWKPQWPSRKTLVNPQVYQPCLLMRTVMLSTEVTRNTFTIQRHHRQCVPITFNHTQPQTAPNDGFRLEEPAID